MPDVADDAAAIGARFRAAWAFARKDKSEVAHALGVSPRTVTRIESGESPLSDHARRITVEETHVPPWFLDYGWEPPPATEDPDLGERVERLESQMRTVLDVIARRVSRDVPEGVPRGSDAGRGGAQ